MHRIRSLCVVLFVAFLSGCRAAPDAAAPANSRAEALASADALPSWQNTPARAAIVEFVRRTTTPGSPGFVPVEERLAVFDNDGTLWAEQPAYFQLFFAVDRVKALAPQHPQWKTEEPFASILRGDNSAALAGGERAILQIIAATHAGLPADEFRGIAAAWIADAVHPVTGRRFRDMVYLPMLELLDLLRAAGYRTCIVSGGGVEFLRAWAFEVYGIPPEQVIGSSLKQGLEVRGGVPVIVSRGEIDFIDDKEGKPLAIHRHFGRRPIIALGNSDGDLEMLQWTAAGQGPRLCGIVHHTDGEREWAYDRDSHIGRLDRALDAACGQGWLLIDMKNDWREVFPPLPAAGILPRTSTGHRP